MKTRPNRNFDYKVPARGRMAKNATSSDRLSTASRYMQHAAFEPSTDKDLAGMWDYLPSVSTVESYFSTGVAAAQAAATTAQSKLPSAAQVSAQAQQMAHEYLPSAVDPGVGSIGPDAYSTVPDTMKATPADTGSAYDQALYWLNFGMARASHDNIGAAYAALKVAYSALKAERDKLTVESWTTASGLACHATGWSCPQKGRAEVLQVATNSITASNLPQTDKDKITSALLSSRRGVIIQQALPLIGFVGAGAVIGTLWYRHRSRR